MNEILSVKNLNKHFQEPEDFHVLKNINFSVARGEFLSIVGKSGCGKSTLLYLLSTLDTNYTGQIFMNGQLLTGKKPAALAAFRNEHIGFVFQFHFLLPEFTALKNVMIPAEKAGKYSLSEIKDRAYEKLKMLDMHEHALKLSSKLSGGQAQRVAIARALINEPSIIMGDEPTGNLDSANTKIVFEILKDLARQGKQSIIAVTHDPEFANNSDRIVEMKDGEIISGA
ncbi:MAG: ABC transporter ATP-binding protein [Chitinophagales bacterium]